MAEGIRDAPRAPAHTGRDHPTQGTVARDRSAGTRMTAHPTAAPRRRRRHRRIAGVAAILVAIAAGCTIAGSASAQTVRFTFTGRGWGHGLGMSQYGAEGMAVHGWNATSIMQWYFRGTQVGTLAGVTSATPVRALMSTGRSTVAIATSTTGTATDLHTGTAYPLHAGSTYTLRAIRLATGTWVVRLTGPNPATATVMQSASGVRVAPGAGGLVTLGGRKYRGTVTTTYAAGLRTINTLGIDDYVRGVVGWEMSPSWRPAALQAQAIAARSYALASRRPASYFDVYGGLPSAAYGGVAAETAATDAAVAATAAQIVTYGSTIVQTFFASSSGGHTESIQNVWGGTPEPYYVGVPDPYETSPEDPWPNPPSFTAAQLGKDLGLGAPVTAIAVTRRGVSPRVIMTRITLSTGHTVNVSGNTIEGDLGLMSTWFSVTRTPSLTPSPGTAVTPAAIAAYVVTHFAYARWHGAYVVLRTEAVTHPGAVRGILIRGTGGVPSRAVLTAFVHAHYAPARRAAALRALVRLPRARQIQIMGRALVAGR
jgi:stage II sporulation protein D